MIFERAMGTETEFGIICPDNPGANDSVLSTLVVDSYPHAAAESGWDYASESPLEDARGFQMGQSEAHPSQLTHQGHVLTSEDIAREVLDDSPSMVNRSFWDRAVMNRVLPNGARFYVDHAHPEYSAPETTNPWDATIWDLAGDRIAAAAATSVGRRYAESWPEAIHLYKNNTDNKSVSYGAHENYLVPRSLNFQKLARHLLPYFATRQVITGAGRAGIGANHVRPGFQISQRADFFEREIGLETTIRRPLVNTRDEPHADPERFRRLHVITGDSNLSHTSTLLKLASAAAVLTLIEHDEVPDLTLANPVQAMIETSHDLTLERLLTLKDGRRMTAVQIQRAYAEAAQQLAEKRGWNDERTRRTFDLWFHVLEALENDVLSLANRLDWVAKYALIRQYEGRGVGLDDPKIQALDLQYADLRPSKSLYTKLVSLGRMKTLVDDASIDDAVVEPPENTRAYLRGKILGRWPHQVDSAGWDVFTVTDPATDRRHRWLMEDPARWTREETEHVINSSSNAHQALSRLGLRKIQ
ncbi:depupylase/deamidase Dop [Kocuria massiliensis]|uniref:depupylase/deamidase Dop n=1 Tax=Kocuria massiliensis TaxID=1926282 RepID=UPI001C48012B|nr:depupylase/deamidase Dop [Kocuria massiliensis]